jgi:hypothetical protein
VGVEGLSGIAARVTEIQSRIVTISRVSTPRTSFATALADAVAPAPTVAASASTATLNADGVPADLAAYGNGRIPASALRTISGTHHRLWAPAAQAFEVLRGAAQRDGVHIGITDSYRSYAEQVDLARRKGLYSQGGLAAKPGTSDHGWGRAVDLSLDAKAQAWMRANAGRFGYVENVSREPWHWTYTAATG